MKIKFKCTKEEYADAFRIHLNSRLMTKLTPIFILLSFIIGVLSFRTGGSEVNGYLAFGAFVCLLGIYLMNRYFLPSYIYKRNSSIGDEYLYEFSEEGIHLTNEKIDAKLCWSKFTSMLSCPKYYLLYMGKDQFTVIPRRIFESKEQLTAFELLLNENIKK